MKIKKSHLILIFALIIGKSFPSFSLGATLGQLASAATGTAAPSAASDSGTKPAEGKSDGIPMNSPLAAISVTPLGVDPSSMDAEVKMPISTDASISPQADPNAPSIAPDSGASGAAAIAEAPAALIDFDLLWTCKRNAVIKDKEKCATAMQFFCAGRCTRLNCAILTNRATCLDICGSSNPMMEPCVMAGKRNIAISSPVQNFPAMGAGYNPMMNGMGMNPGMAGAAMMGSMAASGVGAIASGIGNMFGGDKKDKDKDSNKSKTSSSKPSASGIDEAEASDTAAAQAEMTGTAPATTPAAAAAETAKKATEETKKKKKKKR